MGKSGALPALLSAARVLVLRAVWVEAVEEGKREMYEDAILTDDRAFLALLVGASPAVPALVPTAAIVTLAEGGKMSVAEGKEALGKIERSVRAEAYGAAMQELEKLEESEERKR